MRVCVWVRACLCVSVRVSVCVGLCVRVCVRWVSKCVCMVHCLNVLPCAVECEHARGV